MQWLLNLLRIIRGSPPIDMIFVPSLKLAGTHGQPQLIIADKCYIEFYVESLRLTRARKFSTKFHGVVHSFVAIARDGELTAEYAAVTVPSGLQGVDKATLDKVIVVRKKMVGPVAWRGGTLNLELGLCSVKSGEILTPLIEYVEKISAVAGASFAAGVKPFVPLVKEGMALIAGQQSETAIEVGITANLKLEATGYSAVIAAPKGTIDSAQLSVDPGDRRLLLAGNQLDCGYCVFSVQVTDQRADFGEIPDLKTAYARVREAVRSGRRSDGLDALEAFRFAALASADLIPDDAHRLVERVRTNVYAAFPGGGTGAVALPTFPEDLSQVSLYT